MRRHVVAVIGVIWLLATGCQTVSVQVPPEADLQGVKTVAVVAADLPDDPAPVGVFLRSEASARIRRLLPALTLVEPTYNADAVLRMTVVRHATSPVALRVYVDRQTGQLSCAAWQTASLLVDASVVTGEKIRWQGLLEAERRIDLPCLRKGGAVITTGAPGSVDPYLARDVVDQLGRRLAGYTRREIRAIQSPPPPADQTQDPP